MPVKELSLVALLRVLADPTRLRLLALLGHAELAVGEIARALALSQSRVSNHLKILREHDLVAERRAGSFTFCRLELPEGCAAELWRALEPALAGLREREADERRLAAVLADRADSRAFFDRIAGDWDLIGSDFTRGTGRLEAVGCLVPPGLVVADVGCGTGYLARELGRRVERVICIDSSAAMLDRARDNLAGLPAQLDYRVGSMEALPLADAEVDVACAHMVLHHLAEPAAGLREMARAVRPGGQVVCVELLPHRETWMHTSMADARLGLDPVPLQASFRAAGLTDIRHEMLDDAYVVEHPPGRRIQLPLFLMRGRKPLAPQA
jgi:ubiquinone/menaquinone biosynthesis C-methylase UbiE/DNA-binding transcriptional ArsR family regulator